MKRLAALLLLLSPAFAHEFWIEPSRFEPGVVDLRLKVGDGFPGEAFPRHPRHEREFVVVEGGKRWKVGPRGRVRIRKPAVVGYRSHKSRVTLPARKFNAYLKEAGLERVLRLRARRADPVPVRYCVGVVLQCE